MINLKNYYDFFANHRFYSKEVIVHFLANGWVAISKCDIDTEGRYLHIYDENANLRLKFDSPGAVLVLYKTSFVIVRDFKRRGFVVYYQDKEVNFFSFPDIELVNIMIVDGACLLIKKGDFYQWILTTKSCGGIASNLTEINRRASISSADAFGNVAFMLKDSIYILNVDNKVFKMPNIDKISFLENKRAIIRSKSRSFALIGYDRDTLPEDICREYTGNISLENYVVLLRSVAIHYIKHLSSYAVIFEDALIADLDGNILDRYNQPDKVITITKSGKVIKPYVIEYQGKKGYYPANYGKFFEVNGNTLFVFYYNERFYPILIDELYFDCSKFILDDKLDFEYRRVLRQASLLV